MPKNKVIYWGVVITVAAALLWAGGVFLARIVHILPYFVFFGIAMIVAGVVLELRKNRDGPAPSASQADDSAPM